MSSRLRLSVLSAVPPTIVRFENPEKWHDTCMLFIVRGQPEPTVHFFYKDSELQQTDYVRMEAEVYRDSLEGCLIFKNPTHHNNGNYTLEARNSLGVATKTVYAHFMGAPFDGKNVYCMSFFKLCLFGKIKTQARSEALCIK